MRSTLPMLLVVWLASCGGADVRGEPHTDDAAGLLGARGRSAGPVGDGPKLRSTVQVVDLEIEAGAAESALQLDFQALEAAPILLQLDVVSDPSRIRFRPDVTRIAALPTVRAGVIEPGRLRIILGDATSPSTPEPIESGSLASIPFDLLPGPPGSIPVWVESIVASDPTGEAEGDPQVFPGPAATVSVF
jgi:hypothetical protein